jgi:Carbohydrate esterase, sialic acid-specific acetylesterase/Secretion system C-terminal sorting domain
MKVGFTYPLSRLLRPVFFCVLFSCCFITTFAQVTIDSFPKTLQLYPRNLATNNGRIYIQGKMTGNPFSSLKLRVYRKDLDGNSSGYSWTGDRVIEPTIATSSGNFNYTYFAPAGLYNYAFQLMGVNGLSETSLIYEDDIAVGDAYLIAGQSNAEAYPRPPGDVNLANNEAGTSRNFVRVYGGGGTDGWFIGDANKRFNEDGNTGQFGMRFAARIVAERNMPVAIINSAETGHTIDYFLPKTNHYDLSSNYGIVLTQLKSAGLQGGIRAVVWYQGESNTYNGGFGDDAVQYTTAQYKSRFVTLYNAWEADLGLANGYYIVQIKAGCGGGPQAALDIQEAERQLDNENALMDIVSTNNIRLFDVCHYYYQTYGGYREIGNRLFTLLSRDFYSIAAPANSVSPAPQSASFTGLSSPGVANEITVVFKNPNEDLLEINGDIANLITLNGGSYSIDSAGIFDKDLTAGFNKVLRIKFTRNFGTTTNPSSVDFFGPGDGTIANIPSVVTGGLNGIGLINFGELPVSLGVLPTDPLNLRISANGGANTLYWEVEDNEKFDHYVVERSENNTIFEGISKLQGSQQYGKGNYQHSDTKPNSIRNYYRIKAVQRDGKYIYSQVVGVNNRTSSPLGISVYPNPVTDRANVSISIKKAGVATLQIFDGAGKMISSRKLSLQKGNNSFSAGEVLDHSAGIYIVRVVTEDEVYNTRIVRVK